MNQSAKQDMVQTFARLKERFLGIGGAVRDSAVTASERIENLCTQIYLSQTGAIALRERRIAGYSDTIGAKLAGSVDLRKKSVESLAEGILYRQTGAINEGLNRIEHLAAAIVHSHKTQTMRHEAEKEKRRLLSVFLAVVAILVAALGYVFVRGH